MRTYTISTSYGRSADLAFSFHLSPLYLANRNQSAFLLGCWCTYKPHHGQNGPLRSLHRIILLHTGQT